LRRSPSLKAMQEIAALILAYAVLVDSGPAAAGPV
jgi:hypothetical protein